ncbi:bifunctional proline dehydrogenase/L-glutamate gamma-semialdehyde dehydrogenase PutA [Piscinibacter sakaiensis]|uniref:Bifunctional protein PutA n=1 Tax=Piscinibacter sakaiensis TaxID=1547922 RepID=A0A0K8NXE0_PISS1|nr:bifunctional proline dehydrogenase/L-glutamate gamma-semialdehyde dehydrogenase PutA [Piscinibacter sakaiensis]GAP35046.1 proline dehydrogenase/delta-1-pyrroline-5-carboxylate dehydrogenase [Piscinibacter sakaiensis]
MPASAPSASTRAASAAADATPVAPPGTPARRLPPPVRPEAEVVAALRRSLEGALDWPAVVEAARPWVDAVRTTPAPFWALESLLREYPISSAEGLALMRLAEALLRVPDAETAIALTADQLGRADFDGPAGGRGPHAMLASLSASAIALSKKLLPGAEGEGGLVRRLGAQTVVAATVRAIQLLGRQFVLGRRIAEARAEAAAARRAQPALRASYDMLGEGARTDDDARRYLAAYADAIQALAAESRPQPGDGGPPVRDGISIKLSALFPRYEVAQRERVLAELLPRVWTLVEPAARADINLTIDAEESDRLELSLEVVDALAARIAASHPGWQGFGLAVQAYQTRALAVVDEVARIAERHGLRFMVRLVKGAYWDGEVKRAQELGLAGYPVFTQKVHTDLSYLACARALVAHAAAGRLLPQFATHNAGTIAAVLQLARAAGAPFEMQRLHGMGEGIYREVMRDAAVPVRVYAPVGEHRDLLAYLVRRLLENGANSSFVHQLADESVGVPELLPSPLRPAAEPALPLPRALYGWRPDAPSSGRANALGVDLADAPERAPLEAAVAATTVPAVPEAAVEAVGPAMQALRAAQPAWNATPPAERSAALRRAADRLEAALPTFVGLLVREAHKTLGDAVAEVREAVDFLRYYAVEAEARLAPLELPGPTGERNTLTLHGRGVFVCISPWNFPLAIFTGQVAAALVTGNAVAAKPAEQTPAVAQAAVALLHDAGVPAAVLRLLHGPGETIGAALVADPRTAGVCFTGSTAVARHIHRALAAKDGPIVPLIAETGGLNAMIVDSTALPEQVVDAVVQSAFRSAGQRCSALRLLCLHEGIADAVCAMLAGALRELVLGDPAALATDVGPLIDAEAHANVAAHVERLRGSARCVGETPRGPAAGPTHLAPVAFELARIEDLREEVFGPVLHVVRWQGDVAAVVDAVNALGYGLTLGVQTRIDGRARQIAERAAVGNVYVNRNMVGAVVGVQPFGGEGLSGTGPKAGGPNYLPRFCAEKTVTINTAAAGGNVELLAHRA